MPGETQLELQLKLSSWLQVFRLIEQNRRGFTRKRWIWYNFCHFSAILRKVKALHAFVGKIRLHFKSFVNNFQIRF